MPRDLLDRYNHLRYQTNDQAKDEFVDFLYKYSEVEATDIDVEVAWKKFVDRDTPKKKSNFSFLKIAASMALLVGAAIFIWKVAFAPEQLTISSSADKMSITFPDGSQGVLNQQSTMSFPEKFGNARLVSLQGEAYFDIKKSEKPFIIDMGGVNVTVLGTAFNLSTSEDMVELFVERGLVAFEKDNKRTKVKAGQAATFDKISLEVIIEESPSPNIMSWRNGTFTFDDTPLSTALQELSEYYKFSYKFQNDQLGACKITASFSKSKLEEVIQTLESILEVKITLKDNSLKVSGKGC